MRLHDRSELLPVQSRPPCETRKTESARPPTRRPSSRPAGSPSTSLPGPPGGERPANGVFASLADQFHLNAAQIRKDLAWFGEFGVRGVGYSVAGLAAHLRQILGLAEPINVGVIGAGNLGQALADYPGFPRHGFFPVALFDRASIKVGTTRAAGSRSSTCVDCRPSSEGRRSASR